MLDWPTAKRQRRAWGQTNKWDHQGCCHILNAHTYSFIYVFTLHITHQARRGFENKPLIKIQYHLLSIVGLDIFQVTTANLSNYCHGQVKTASKALQQISFVFFGEKTIKTVAFWLWMTVHFWFDLGLVLKIFVSWRHCKMSQLLEKTSNPLWKSYAATATCTTKNRKATIEKMKAA